MRVEPFDRDGPTEADGPEQPAEVHLGHASTSDAVAELVALEHFRAPGGTCTLDG
jgi:hypothetical protein